MELDGVFHDRDTQANDSAFGCSKGVGYLAPVPLLGQG